LGEVDVRRMRSVFAEIYSFVSEHPLAYSLTLNSLDPEARREMEGWSYVTDEDVARYLEVEYTRALPRAAGTLRGFLLDRVRGRRSEL